MRVGTFDIETDDLMPDATLIHCAVVKDHADGSIVRFTPDNIDTLPAHLGGYDVLIGHNCIGFDFPVLRKIYGWEFNGIKVDTLLMSRMQRPKRQAPASSNSGPHSVESWGIRLGRDKVENDQWETYTPHMLHRCEEDVEIQYEIYHALLEEGKGEGWASAHKLNHKLHHYLQLQEEAGWAVDEEQIDWCIYMLRRWMDRIKAVLEDKLPIIWETKETKKDGERNYVRRPFTKAGRLSAQVTKWAEETDFRADHVAGQFSRIFPRRLNLDKNKEVKDFLLDQGWEPAEWNSNAEGKRTSPKLSKDDDFIGVQGSMGKLIAKRVQCKQRLGVVEGWRDVVQHDEHGVPRIHGGVSGIASTARLKHKVIVNVPSPEKESFFAVWMRKIFTASPGMVMVGVDSAGNQMRQLASRMREAGYKDEEFEHALLHGDKAKGTDLHSVNQRRADLPTRGHAKNFFYGFIFGSGDAKTGKLVQGSAAIGKAIKEEYLNNMPGLRATIESLTAEWRATAQHYYNQKFGRMEYRNGYITGRDGRPILVESEHTVLCYALQSDEAIQMSIAYCILHKRAENKGWTLGKDWRMLIWYHDEFQMESRPELSEELLAMGCDAIKWAGEFLKIPFPHEGDGSIGRNWYECH
jgi:hypothetical protein